MDRLFLLPVVVIVDTMMFDFIQFLNRINHKSPHFKLCNKLLVNNSCLDIAASHAATYLKLIREVYRGILEKEHTDKDFDNFYQTRKSLLIAFGYSDKATESSFDTNTNFGNATASPSSKQMLRDSLGSASENAQPLLVNVQNGMDLDRLKTYFDVDGNEFIDASRFCNKDELPRIEVLLADISMKKKNCFLLGLTSFLRFYGEEEIRKHLANIVNMTFTSSRSFSITS